MVDSVVVYSTSRTYKEKYWLPYKIYHACEIVNNVCAHVCRINTIRIGTTRTYIQ